MRGFLRVWSGVGHGQKSWLGVLSGEVLIGELLTIDGLATSALRAMSANSLMNDTNREHIRYRE